MWVDMSIELPNGDILHYHNDVADKLSLLETRKLITGVTK